MSNSNKKIDKIIKYASYGALPIAFTAGILSPQIGKLISPHSIGGSVASRQSRMRNRNIPDINPVIQPTKAQEKLMNTMSVPTNQSGDKSSSLKYIIPATAIIGTIGAVGAADIIKKGAEKVASLAFRGGSLKNDNVVEEKINNKKYVVPTSYNSVVQNLYEKYNENKKYIPAAALIASVAGVYLGRNYLPTFFPERINIIQPNIIDYTRPSQYPVIIPQKFKGEGLNKKQQLAMSDLYLMPTMK